MTKKIKVSQVNEPLGRVMTKKRFLLLVIVLSLSVLVACGNLLSTETQGEETATVLQPEIMETLSTQGIPVAVETPFVEVTPSTEAIPAPEKKKIFLSEKIEYEGKVFDFEISVLTSDKIMMDTFEKFGIESFAINEEKPNARELLAKTLAFSFLETYNFQNKTNVSLEEYLTNPGNFPARVMVRNAEGKIEGQTLTIDKIQAFEMRYTSGMKGELFMNILGQSSESYGYGIEGGKFVIYVPLSPGDQQLKIIIDYDTEKPEVLMYEAGFMAAHSKFIYSVSMLPYTAYRLEENGDMGIIEGTIMTNSSKIAEAVWPGGRMSEEEAVAIFKKQIFFTILIK